MRLIDVLTLKTGLTPCERLVIVPRFAFRRFQDGDVRARPGTILKQERPPVPRMGRGIWCLS